MPSSTCLAPSGDGSGNNICQQPTNASSSSLPPLPPIIHHDKQAYLEQRLGLPPLSSDKESNNNIPTSDECRLYMAPSSIPNTGLGMYAGVKISPSTMIDLNPQPLIPLLDINAYEDMTGGVYEQKSVLRNYPWADFLFGMHLEARSSKVLYPSIGMLANSHLGLINAQLREVITTSKHSRVTDRSLNAGTGASVPQDALNFKTSHNKGIGAGEEIFVDYGPAYFHAREDRFGALFPTINNYKTADAIVKDFLDTHDDLDSIEAEVAWEGIITSLEDGTYQYKDDENVDKEEGEEKRKKTQERIAYALPDFVDDLPDFLELGTARKSVPDSVRSLVYLRTLGICLDNLRKGKSSIPQAGYGAFATNNLYEDSVIVAAPVIPIERITLDMSWEVKDSSELTKMKQILLNYCFGHPESSVLLFPYSGSVQYINHSENPNAFISWSLSEMNNDDLLEQKANDLGAGLVLDIVALRDIGIGEEITIDYGTEWTNSWYDHVTSWKMNDARYKVNPQSVIETQLDEEKPFLTMEEQQENPYPTCVRTACYSTRTNGIWSEKSLDDKSLKFCDVTGRVYYNNNYWYTVKIHSESDSVVKHVPHQAITFFQDIYCSDLHLGRVFRHEIGVPEDTYPDLWLDLDDVDNIERTLVTCDTTVGQFVMMFERDWSPNGYDRAVELFERGFYDHSHFFRVIPDFLTQFGMR